MKTSPVAFLCSIALCCLFFDMHAQVPSASLLKDVNTDAGTLREENNYEPYFCACGDYLYFPVTNHLGTELWRTDGTSAGTVMVKDIRQGVVGGLSIVRNFACAQNKLVFFANDGATGMEPWISDGTEAGTRLLKDILPGSGSSPLQAVTTGFDGKAYFTISTLVNSELWQTDGTEAGTVLLHAVAGHSFLMASTDEYLYFVVSGQVNQLWRTDGTTAGTTMVKQVSYPEGFRFLKGGATKMYFIIDDISTVGGPRALWVSDGSEAGTTLVEDLGTRNPISFYTIEDDLILSGSSQTWWSDGTPGGFFKLGDMITSGGTVAGSTFYGAGFDFVYNAYYLYSLDASSLVRTDLADLGGSLLEAQVTGDEIVMLDDKLLLPIKSTTAGIEMGTFDIGQVQAEQLRDVFPGAQGSNPRASVKFKDKCFFLANDGVHGSEIWMTDGTVGGTVLLKDINTGTKDGVNGVANLTTLNDEIFFLSAPEFQFSKDVWKSNGTEGGTQKYHDFTGMGAGVFVGKRNSELIYFHDGKLYKTNGQQPGLALIKDLGDLGYSNSVGSNISIAFGDKLLFRVTTGGTSPAATGGEYWITDGTASGTHILKDIMPGSGTGVLFITGAELGNRFIFYAEDGVTGREVWTTDGTEAGTVLLKDVRPGAEGSFAQSFVRFGDQVLFTASDGVHGPEIWKTDGTTAGTTMITDVFATNAQMPRYLTNVGDKVLFAGYDAAQGWAIWKTDGTASGTALIKDISPETSTSVVPSEFMTTGDRLYFSLAGNVWVSDGTEAGTKMIVEDTGVTNGENHLFTDAGGLVYYRTQSGLWKMNATGTHRALVSDLQPVEMIYHNGVIYFTAVSAAYGTEVFKAPVPKFEQSIAFNPVDAQPFPASPYTLQGTATSGLPVTYTSADDKVSISGNTVTFLKPGTVTITAKQPGDGAFLAAAEVAHTFCILPPKPTITYTNPGNVFAILSSGSENGNQWFRNDVKLEGETSQTLQTETSGRYTVQVSAGECSSALSDALEVVITSTELQAAPLSVYPNPANDVLSIQAGDGNAALDVEIIDVHGKMIAHYYLHGNERIDHSVNGYNSGLYLIRVVTPQGVVLRKWVKQ